MTNQEALERLKSVIDPELHVNIVDLGLIYKVEVNWTGSPKIYVLMTVTSPACPLVGTFHFMVRDAYRDVPDLDPDTEIEVELTFDPPWTQDMMTAELQAQFGMDEW